MINITRNKSKYVRDLKLAEEYLAHKLYYKLNPILKKIFVETSIQLKHGDPLNIVPTIVNRYTNPIKTELEKQYRVVGQYSYNKVIGRINEVNNKKYYRKENQESFWYFFNTWIRSQGLSKVTMVNETTKNILRKIIDKGLKEGKTYEQIAKEIRSIEEISSRNRSLMIAITESHTAFSKSIFESIQSTNIEMDSKEWWNAGDDRVREAEFNHVIAQGEKVGMNEQFVMTGEPLDYAGDYKGSPGNIIRCRCFNLYNTAPGEIR